MKLQKILSLALLVLASAGASAQMSETHSLPVSLPVPSSGTGGAAGGVGNPANAASVNLSCTEPRLIDRLKVGVDLTHSAVGNLRIEVSHCGTTVVLYDQSPASMANLTGVYEFEDNAPATFASAVQAAPLGGAVTPGSYAPAGSLGVFTGSSSGGQWTIKVYDLTQFDVGVLLGVTLTVYTGQQYISPTPPGPIADGVGGNCLSPFTQVWNVPEHGPIDFLVVDLNVTHTYVSDLEIWLQHAGVSVLISQAGSPFSNADLSGWYTFYDGAQTAWTTAETSYANSVIPSNVYRPKEPLSAFLGVDKFGPWYLTICDRSAGDLGTVNQPAQIHAYVSPWDLSLSQPNGSASITVANKGGIQGHIYANLFTLAPGNAPFGWLFGLDITLPNLIAQMDFGAPFVGLFDACGNASLTIPGPIPPNLTVWYVSIHVSPDWMPLAVERLGTYTTSP